MKLSFEGGEKIMKKIISFILTFLMLFSVSLAQTRKAPMPPKKSTVKKTTPAPAPEAKKVVYAAPKAKKSELSVSPKGCLYTGNGGSSFAIGCEVSKPVMDNVDLMGEIIYILPNGGVSNIVFSGNGIYKFEKMQGLPGDLYAGGGLNYNLVSGNGFSASGMGFQGLVGMDFAVGDGIAFGQLKYVSYTYSVPATTTSAYGITITIPGYSVSSSGLVLEGGYRFAM